MGCTQASTRETDLRQGDVNYEAGGNLTQAAPPARAQGHQAELPRHPATRMRTRLQAAVRWEPKARQRRTAMMPPNVAYDLSLHTSTMRLSVIEAAVFALHAEIVERESPASGRSVPKAPIFSSHRKDGDMKKGARSSTRSAGRSTHSARRSSALRRCCNCSSEMWGAQAAE